MLGGGTTVVVGVGGDVVVVGAAGEERGLATVVGTPAPALPIVRAGTPGTLLRGAIGAGAAAPPAAPIGGAGSPPLPAVGAGGVVTDVAAAGDPT